MNLYYVHPHWLFDHPDMDLDHDHAFFIIAASPRDALELWLNQINAVHNLALSYSHQVTSADIEAILAGTPGAGRVCAERCIEVRDVTFDLRYAMSQVIPWEELQPQSFILKEF
jgi:hypothetical protein